MAMSGCQNPPPPRIQDGKGSASVRSSETDERKNTKATQTFTHAEFHDWFLQELCTQQPALYEEYTTTFHAAAAAVTQWRKRFQGDRALWQRLFDKQGVMKEFVEACPIIDAVQRLVDASSSSSSSSEPFTIVDLASGKGTYIFLLNLVGESGTDETFWNYGMNLTGNLIIFFQYIFFRISIHAPGRNAAPFQGSQVRSHGQGLAIARDNETFPASYELGTSLRS